METRTIEVQDRHKKQLAVMRGWLEGKQFFIALEALEIVRNLELGLRKDGCTPKFHHQLSVARLVSTLTPHLVYPEETITAAFLHDILEDHGDAWSHQALTAKFGQRIADAVWKLTKKYNGLSKTYESYFNEMTTCPIASIVKLADRAHNLQTMQGAFDTQKQEKYIKEVGDLFYPMIKQARRNFPKQYGAYENLKILLRCQTRLIEQGLHAAATTESIADKLLRDVLQTLRSVANDNSVAKNPGIFSILEKFKNTLLSVEKYIVQLDKRKNNETQS